MKKVRSKLPVLKSKDIDLILQELEEIDSAFGWKGFDSAYEADPLVAVAADPGVSGANDALEELFTDLEEEDDDEDEDDYFSERLYDREDMEIAVDAFLTNLAKSKLIHKDKKGRLPSFQDVFTSFFGKDSELAKLAANFEEYIEGYFDSITYENMNQAHHAFHDIVSGVKNALEARA